MRLVDLAKKEYSNDLSAVEIKLLEQASNGLGAEKLSTEVSEIRSTLIRWLCMNLRAKELINPKGILIEKKIIKDLDLEDLCIPFPIILRDCELFGELVLRDSITKNVFLEGCIVHGISADRVTVNGALIVFNCQVFNGISLSNSRISGEVNFSKSRLYPKKNGDYALDLSMSQIEGALIFDLGFRSCGILDLSGIQIGGSLSLQESVFLNKGKAIIAANQIRVRTINLSMSRFNGIISFEGSQVDGDFIGENAKVNCKQGKWAMHLTRITIKGSLRLSKTKILGAINLKSAILDGNLTCSNTLLNAGSTYYTIDASNAKVGGSILLNDKFRSVGEINFQGATIDGELNLNKSLLLNKGNTSLNLTNCKIKQSAIGNLSFRSYGRVDLDSVEVQGRIDFSTSMIVNRTGDALDLSSASVKGRLLFDSSRIDGRLLLASSVFNSEISFDDGYFNNEQGVTIFADGFKVDSTVFMSRIRSFGHIRMVNGKIGGSLECYDSKLNQKIINEDRLINSLALEATFLEVGSAVFIVSTEIAGRVSFYGSEVAGDFDFINVTFLDINKSGLDLSTAKINQSFYWRPTKIAEDTFLFLNHTQVRLFIDNSGIWPASNLLTLDGFKFESLKSLQSPKEVVDLGWLLDRKDQQSLQPYQHLAEVLRENGREQLAKKVLITKERTRRKGMKGFSRVWSWFLDISIRYGFQPYRPLLVALLFLIAGVFVFQWGYQNKLYLLKDEESKIVNFNAVVYSLDAFIPLIDYHQEDARLPKSDKVCIDDKTLNCGMILTVYYWIHITMGWFLSTLFAISFTNLVRQGT